MLAHKIDILNLEYPQSDRDRHIITPVYLYLREKYKLNVKSEYIWNGFFYLLKYRPKMLLLSNSCGGDINFLLTKIAHNMGIKVVALVSEGNFGEGDEEEFFWGWNKEKILYEDAKILWSERTKNFILKGCPKLKDKIYVSGATGFDRYKLLKFMNKEEFLAKSNLKKYKKIIGIAGWGFHVFFESSVWQAYKELYLSKFGKDQIEMHRRDLFSLRDIYKKLIENNRDILFILRFHPATMNVEKSEFFGLDNYENVYISYNPCLSQIGIKIKQDYISDLINASDLWIGYYSTTLLEAWLLGKTTFLINPTRIDFIRDNTYKGSPIVLNYEDAQKLITGFFENGKINEFELLEKERKRIIKEVIEYDDGRNHIRAAKIIYKIFLEENEKTKRIQYNNFPWVATLKQFLSFGLDKFFKRRNYDIGSEIKYYEDLYLPAIKNEISENGK